MFESLYKPFYSKEFYSEKIAAGGRSALKFMFVLWIVVGLLFALFSFLTSGLSVKKDLDQFSAQDFPDKVSLIDGRLSLVGVDMPIEFIEDGKYFAVDTTGKIVEIPNGYSDGALFTQEKMIFRSKDSYGDQEALYSTMVQNDIEFTKGDIEQFSDILTLWLMVLIPVYSFLSVYSSNIFGIVLMSLLGAVVLRFMKMDNVLRKSFIIVVYAAFPVFIVTSLQELLTSLLPETLSLLLCCLGFVFWFVKWGYFFWLGTTKFKN